MNAIVCVFEENFAGEKCFEKSTSFLSPVIDGSIRLIIFFNYKGIFEQGVQMIPLNPSLYYIAKLSKAMKWLKIKLPLSCQICPVIDGRLTVECPFTCFLFLKLIAENTWFMGTLQPVWSVTGQMCRVGANGT